MERALGLACILTLMACGGKSTRVTDGGPDSDADTDSDGDTDGDTDTETESDTGTGSDTDTGSDTSCDLTLCGEACVDLGSDEGNCGACGYACGAGVECTDGLCTCGGVTCREGEDCVAGACQCAAGRVDCVALCADISSDERNCGSCGVECPVGGTCDAGRCVCPAGLVNCGDYCADTASDEANCGSCGDFCAGTCNSGVCECGAALEECVIPEWLGGGSVCTDTQIDPSHCGACNTACQFGEYCKAGACVCIPGYTECDVAWGGGATFCTDLQTDPDNCGDCGVDCADPARCSAGVCADVACPAELSECDRSGDGDIDLCTDFDVDELHCGECRASQCTVDQVCTAGSCEDWVPAFGCVACPCDDVCGEGTACCTYPDDPDGFAICVYADVCPT